MFECDCLLIIFRFINTYPCTIVQALAMEDFQERKVYQPSHHQHTELATSMCACGAHFTCCGNFVHPRKSTRCAYYYDGEHIFEEYTNSINMFLYFLCLDFVTLPQSFAITASNFCASKKKEKEEDKLNRKSK